VAATVDRSSGGIGRRVALVKDGGVAS